MKKEIDDNDRSGGDDELFFEDAFELTGNGRFNHLVLLTSGLILLNVSMESVGMSYVISAAECDLHLSNQQKGLVSAASFIGIIFTSFLWGYLGDRAGRRAVMMPALVGSAIASVASSFSTNVWMLLTLRIFTGCLVSASSATVYAYLGETHMNSRRASAIAWSSVFISFSFITLPGLAWVFIPGKWSFDVLGVTVVPWRAFIWTWCAPGLAAAFLMFFLPESPRFLLSTRGPDAALSVLALMYSWNKRAASDTFPVKKIITSNIEVAKVEGFAGAVKNIALLFKPPLLKCVIISHLSMFTVFMLSSGLYMWVPDILNNILKNTSEESLNICKIIQEKIIKQNNATLQASLNCSAEVSVGVFPISMGMGAVFALTYFAIGVFINKIGRKTLYCGIMVVCGVTTIAAAFVPQGAAATALLIIALCSGCAASILAAIAVDVFPTCLRAMAMCIMYMVGRTGAAIGSYVIGATLNSYCIESFSFIGALSAASTLLLLLWPKPERVREKLEQLGLIF